MLSKLAVAAVVLALPVLSIRAQSDTLARPAVDSAAPAVLEPIVALGRSRDLVGRSTTASEGFVGRRELLRRPLTRQAELLESVPGMVVTQHSGEGKANQYFVRGFNLDHGTDFRTTLEGIPLNMVSHAHGQGYTDLNILIPELVEHIEYRLGNYDAAVGDFGSAGSADIRLVDRLSAPLVEVSTGANGFTRGVTAGSFRIGGGALLLGGEVGRYEGPFTISQDVRRYSGVARYSASAANSRWSITGLGYRNRWQAADQIPQRAVVSGLITRLGNLEADDGGASERYSLSGRYRHAGVVAVQDVELYAADSSLDLFSNFTYFLDDPINGDQFNQREKRVTLGGRARVTRPFGAEARHLVSVGLENRVDLIRGLGLYHTAHRQRIGTVREDDVNQGSAGTYAEVASRWTDRLRTTTGVRVDALHVAVSSDRAANSGTRTSALVSPKLTLAYRLGAEVEAYASGGFGYHSNDARGATIRVDPATGEAVDAVDPLVRTRGGEVGLRIAPRSGWQTTLSVWTLGLDSELLFVGDAGTTEASGASRRDGITIANFASLGSHLALDLDLSLTRARLTDVVVGESPIPGSVGAVLAAGASWVPGPSGAFGTVRLRHIGGYPLTEDGSQRAPSATQINLAAGYRLANGLRVEASLLNATNARDNDIAYYYASRLQGEPAGGVEDTHFHPVEPRQIRVRFGIDL